ncbi:MAG: YebC/PmpR family DNA-binding transcriptional regulator [Alphaproteobacteria bacterium]|nr:YebC/PmpR family DNA-binding transcriptional regulator [Alphaproteobacteria bacterium]
MAGHSKWANIKRRKGAQDAARGKLFTKLIKEITVAARMGGGDADANPRLRLAIDKAKGQSMPRDNIERAIAKGTGDVDMSAYEDITMEGYGPGGVAVLIEALTDNRNRTTAEVRWAFKKGNGNLGTDGCVSYMFNRKGVITVLADGVDEDELMMTALDAGAEDVVRDGDSFEITTDPSDFHAVRDALTADFTLDDDEVTFVPDTRVEIAGDDAEGFLRLIEMLEDSDDVQNVHHNADISDEELERITG